VRTIVEVETSDGYVGLGEMGGGGEDATRAFTGLRRTCAATTSSARGDALAICNPTASLYNNRTQLHAALEFACLDIMGRSSACPCTRCSAASCATRSSSRLSLLPLSRTRTGRGRSAHAGAARRQRGASEAQARLHVAQAQGRRVPAHARARVLSRARASRCPASASLRPQRALSLSDAIAVRPGIDDIRNDYFEDPVWGMSQMKRLREFVPLPTATNTVVVNFEQLARTCATARRRRDPARHNVLGRHPPLHQGGRRLRDDGARVAVHSSASSASSSRPCCTWARSCRTWATRPTRIIIICVDDVIAGRAMPYENGAIACRTPRARRTLDRDKLAHYHELFRELGGYPYDRDPGPSGLVPSHSEYAMGRPRRFADSEAEVTQ
jgi:glucarate dehydratase